jgi:hypothetical protein
MDGFISRIVDNNMYAAIQEIAALHCVPLAMTYKGVIASRLLSVIARRRSRRSNLEDRRAELAMTLEEIATLHCVPLAMTYKGVIARRRSRRSNLISICHCEEAEPTKQSRRSPC